MSFINNMNQRSVDIFKRIVETYLDSGEASGSRNIAKSMEMALSPASVRNVMADLEDNGLIFAPHTSAARLPTQAGLRFFVDTLIEGGGSLSQKDRTSIEAQIHDDNQPDQVETILNNASQVLSGVSQCAGVVMTTKTQAPLKQIEFMKLEPQKVLAVLVFENGDIENRLMQVDADLPASALVTAANYFNSKLVGKSLNAAHGQMKKDQATLQRELDVLSHSIVEAGLATWSGGQGERPQSLIVRGQAHLLENLDAENDLERLRQLFQDFESQREIMEVLGRAENSEGVQIFIGRENDLFSLSGSSVVVAPYTDSNHNVVGIMGVVGPTRLNYSRIIPVVDHTAQVVSALLQAQGKS